MIGWIEDTWRAGERLLQPWRATAAALGGLLARVRPRRRVRVSPLSRDWLRQHEIDAVKHRDLH